MRDSTKSLSEAIANIALSEEMKRARDAFHKAFDDMPEEKINIVNRMFGPWGCCAFATEAYSTVLRNDLNDEQRLCTVGVFADCCLAAIRDIELMLNKNTEETLGIIDSTSEYLIKKGWHGLPSPIDEKGSCCYKTAHGMYNDMVMFSKTRDNYIKTKAIQEEENAKRR